MKHYTAYRNVDFSRECDSLLKSARGVTIVRHTIDRTEWIVFAVSGAKLRIIKAGFTTADAARRYNFAIHR